MADVTVTRSTPTVTVNRTTGAVTVSRAVATVSVTRSGLTGPAGPAGANGDGYLRRYDASGSYSYCGVAVSGSAESDEVWTITRIDRTTLATAQAADVAWDDRLTASYS